MGVWHFFFPCASCFDIIKKLSTEKVTRTSSCNIADILLLKQLLFVISLKYSFGSRKITLALTSLFRRRFFEGKFEGKFCKIPSCWSGVSRLCKKNSVLPVLIVKLLLRNSFPLFIDTEEVA